MSGEDSNKSHGSNLILAAFVIAVGMVIAANMIDINVQVNVTDKPITSNIDKVEQISNIERRLSVGSKTLDP